MDTRVAARFCVRGRVQGVGFRASTAREARALALDGYARNRSDGSVEVEASGPAEAVDLLGAWLAHGPVTARVTQVEREAIDPDAVNRGFVVR